MNTIHVVHWMQLRKKLAILLFIGDAIFRNGLVRLPLGHILVMVT